MADAKIRIVVDASQVRSEGSQLGPPGGAITPEAGRRRHADEQEKARRMSAAGGIGGVHRDPPTRDEIGTMRAFLRGITGNRSLRPEDGVIRAVRDRATQLPGVNIATRATDAARAQTKRIAATRAEIANAVAAYRKAPSASALSAVARAQGAASTASAAALGGAVAAGATAGMAAAYGFARGAPVLEGLTGGDLGALSDAASDIRTGLAAAMGSIKGVGAFGDFLQARAIAKGAGLTPAEHWAIMKSTIKMSAYEETLMADQQAMHDRIWGQGVRGAAQQIGASVIDTAFGPISTLQTARFANLIVNGSAEDWANAVLKGIRISAMKILR